MVKQFIKNFADLLFPGWLTFSNKHGSGSHVKASQSH
jgi:hypothetical protein